MSGYPVYVSPDGKHEQVAATPVRQVQLKHAGWRPKQDVRPEPDRAPDTRKRPAVQAGTPADQ
jgi:hypothetical protein